MENPRENKGRPFRRLAFSALILFSCMCALDVYGRDIFPVKIAVEFTNHAACAYVALDMGWMEDEGLKPTIYPYVTGMSLAAALGRGDIQAAYLCLLPAINAYANAQVPLKIVAGTHKHGYGLVANPNKVKEIRDLEKPGVRIGCVRQGGPADAILMKAIEKYDLDPEAVLRRIQRMNPARQIMSIKMGRLDAAFVPEHWPVLAEELGFEMLITSRDVWPNMQGSVLIVRQELIKDHPEIVEKLVKITCKATRWIKQNPRAASRVMSRWLQVTSGQVFSSGVDEDAVKFDIIPEMMLKSMLRMEYSVAIDPYLVQQMIDYAALKGNIKAGFDAADMLDLRFMDDEER